MYEILKIKILITVKDKLQPGAFLESSISKLGVKKTLKKSRTLQEVRQGLSVQNVPSDPIIGQ
jgi:hypothetical protein